MKYPACKPQQNLVQRAFYNIVGTDLFVYGRYGFTFPGLHFKAVF